MAPAAAAAPAKKHKSKTASVVSGSLSGAVVSACVQPLDVIRTRMQADMAHGVVRNTLHTMQTIMAEVRHVAVVLSCAVPSGCVAWQAGTCCTTAVAVACCCLPTLPLLLHCLLLCRAGRRAHVVEGHAAYSDPAGLGRRTALLLLGID